MRQFILFAMLATLAAIAPRAEAQQFDRIVCTSDNYERRFCPAATSLAITAAN